MAGSTTATTTQHQTSKKTRETSIEKQMNGVSFEAEAIPERELKDQNIKDETENIKEETENIKEETQNMAELNDSAKSNDEAESGDICKFYTEGRCRFGEECINLHRGPVIQASDKSKRSKGKKEGKTGKKDSPTEEIGKKKRMKTALDVIKRIKWDSDFPEDEFIIGYVDRFLGIVEDSFTSFCWGDLAAMDWDTLAIPQHRIHYFKYKSSKVWDKDSRLDIVFGSTGNNEHTIHQFMRKVDLEEEARSAQDKEDEDTDEDEEEAESICVQVPNLNDQLHRIADEFRSTHFLAVRVSGSDELAKRLVRVQNEVANQDPVLRDCCMKPGLFHITLGMLRIQDIEGIQAAVDVVDRMKEEAASVIRGRNTDLHIRNLNEFGHRVLYAEVHPADPVFFQDFVQFVADKFAGIKDKVQSTNSFEFIPHLTLIKVSRPTARIRKSKYIDQSFYRAMSKEHFGVQALDNLQLCIIESSTRYDGFYTTLTDVKLS